MSLFKHSSPSATLSSARHLHPNPLDTLSTRHKVLTLTLRALATACSFSALSLFFVSLFLYLVRAPGGFDADCAFKYLSIAGATFSAAYHLFNMILMGSGTLNRVPRPLLLCLEIGSGVLLALLGYMSYAQDRMTRHKDMKDDGYHGPPTKGEEPIKVGALGALSAACAAHLGFFIFLLLTGPTPSVSFDPTRPISSSSSSSSSCSNCIPLQKIHSTTTAADSVRTTERPASNATANQQRERLFGEIAGTSGTPTNATSPVRPGSARRSIASSPCRASGQNSGFARTPTQVQNVPDEDAPAYTAGDYQRSTELRAMQSSSRIYTPIPVPVSPLDAPNRFSPSASRDPLLAGGAYPFPTMQSTHLQDQPPRRDLEVVVAGASASQNSTGPVRSDEKRPTRHSRLFSDAGDGEFDGRSYRTGSPDVVTGLANQDGFYAGRIGPAPVDGMMRRSSMRKEG